MCLIKLQTFDDVKSTFDIFLKYHFRYKTFFKKLKLEILSDNVRKINPHELQI
jgi:hypothetical protein